jgi:hypothetical protein
MAGLDPAIHVGVSGPNHEGFMDVDARNKCGHDEEREEAQVLSHLSSIRAQSGGKTNPVHAR